MPIAMDDINMASTPLCHIVTPVGMLGYGFNEEEISDVLALLVSTGTPTAIILDSGSTDSGPSKLALGTMTCPRSAYVRDISKLLKLVHTFRVPLLFSSAGGDGSDEHVRDMLRIIEEIAAEEDNSDYSFKAIGVYSGIEKAVVLDRLRTGRIRGCGTCVPELTEEDIETSSRIVAQMGPEPFVDAMKANGDFDVIVGGRAYDPSPYTAYATYLSNLQLDDQSDEKVQSRYGGFTHMGKIMECGGACAEPKSSGAIATVYRDGSFTITPTDKQARCTPLSVASHTLYEKSRPDILHGPGGHLDLNDMICEQLQDERTVKVRGSRFHFSQESGRPYQVKLEGASFIGYRSMYMGSFRDPILISQIDVLIERIKGYVAMQHRDHPGTWELDFHYYGKPNDLQNTTPDSQSREVFIIGEALASSQELATSIANTAKVASTHGSYPGQKATSGNFAFGIGGLNVIELGACPKFSLYHLMDLESGEEHIPGDEMTLSSIVNGAHSERKPLFSQSVSLFGKGQRPSVRQSPIPTPQPSRDAKTNGAKTEDKTRTQNGFVSPKTLGELARVMRSKNSGPYEITFDVMFGSKDIFQKVKESGLLSPRVVAAAFNLPEEDIIWCGFFDPAMAFKATIPRIRGGKKVAGGSFMENDVHGSQQYLPLMNLKLPEELVAN